MTATKAKASGRFTLPGTSLTLDRTGYGAMQLAGPGVWGPPDSDAAIAVLREAVAPASITSTPATFMVRM